MAKLNDDLAEIITARNDMKSALALKGQTVTNDIRTYAEAISHIEGGSKQEYDEYTQVDFTDFDNDFISHIEFAEDMGGELPVFADLTIYKVGANRTGNNYYPYIITSKYTSPYTTQYNGNFYMRVFYSDDTRKDVGDHVQLDKYEMGNYNVWATNEFIINDMIDQSGNNVLYPTGKTITKIQLTLQNSM